MVTAATHTHTHTHTHNTHHVTDIDCYVAVAVYIEDTNS